MDEIFDAVEELEKAQEAVNINQHQGGEAGKVRKIVTTVMKQLGIRNKIDDVRLDNHIWQVDFSSSLDSDQRKVITDLITEQLGIIGIKPKTIRLVGLYPGK